MAKGRNNVPALLLCSFCTAVKRSRQTLQPKHYSYAAPQNVIDFLQRCTFPRSRDTIRIKLRSNLGDIIMTEALAAWTPRALSVLRIITGLLIIQHGLGKIIHFPAFPAYANVQPLSLLGAAGFIELIGGALLILGLFTRPAAFILSGEMAFAYFIAHAPKDFHPLVNGGTLAILYCFTCLYLSTAGAGPWSLDAAMKRD
jgi:putative oxidoreductase